MIASADTGHVVPVRSFVVTVTVIQDGEGYADFQTPASQWAAVILLASSPLPATGAITVSTSRALSPLGVANTAVIRKSAPAGRRSPDALGLGVDVVVAEPESFGIADGVVQPVRTATRITAMTG